MDSITVYSIGLMSGTSLDGLDVAYCKFTFAHRWSFELLASHNFPYSAEWIKRLSELENTSAWDFAKTNVDLGHYFGQKVNEFRSIYSVPKLDFIASHGHTIFHRPEIGVTVQIADIDSIAAETKCQVVGNFRTLDVALGGQGAPLVPIGDDLLFAKYGACLNLGGFSNVSFCRANERIAFDISPCNMVLNYLASRIGMHYDKDGECARIGNVNQELLYSLNNLEYYKKTAPKSLGKEWFVEHIIPLMSSDIPTHDLLRTCVEHIAMQISSVLNTEQVNDVIITGGGALNKFLIERLSALVHCSIHIPSKDVVDYKEAIIFAFLGTLRVLKLNNCLSSVTGAAVDCCGGNIAGLF